MSMSRALIDSDLLRPEAIEPETRAFMRWLAREADGEPRMYEQGIVALRDELAAGDGLWGLSPRFAQVEDRVIRYDGLQVPVAVYTPQEVRGICLDLHGGGFCLGFPHQSDDALVDLADRLNLAIVSVDYRLAPEHPFPAAVNDCATVAAWLVEHASDAFGSDRLIMSGTSAGANLAVVALTRLRERHGRTGYCAVSLEYGCFSLPPLPSRVRLGEDCPLLSPGEVTWLWQLYAPHGLELHPEVSPLYADLSDLPPALFTVGTADPLLDDSVMMAYRWARAGNRTELAIYPGCPHAFLAFPFAAADRANANIEGFLRRAINAGNAPNREEGR
jgi:acetyl esterase